MRTKSRVTKEPKAAREPRIPGCAADKLRNPSALIRDVQRDGPETMRRFNASADQVIWYHAGIADALEPHRDRAPVGEMREATEVLAGLLHVPA